MINNFKLKNHKGIKELYLENLDKINIICGKNNSGKTSILEALTTSSKVEAGLNNFQESSEMIFNEVAQVFSKFPKLKFPTQEFINESIIELLPDNGIFYFGQIKELEEKLYLKYIDLNPGTPTKPNSDNSAFFKIIQNAYLKNITSTKESLIRAKRSYSTSVNVGGVQFSQNGNGLTNELFFLKNCEEGSKKHKIFKKIKHAFFKITNSHFHVNNEDKGKLNISFTINSSSKNIKAHECGTGILEILFLITYIHSTDYSYYLIDEPENHLHADFQNNFLNHLREIENKKFILATHSETFLDINKVDKIYYCWYDGEVHISDKTTISKMVDS